MRVTGKRQNSSPTKFTTCFDGAIGSAPTAPPPNPSTANCLPRMSGNKLAARWIFSRCYSAFETSSLMRAVLSEQDAAPFRLLHLSIAHPKKFGTVVSRSPLRLRSLVRLRSRQRVYDGALRLRDSRAELMGEAPSIYLLRHYKDRTSHLDQSFAQEERFLGASIEAAPDRPI
jgi:hypothetical protein